MKTCYRCKKKKPLTEFRQYKSGINKGYYYSYCKKCKNELQNEYRKKGYFKDYYKKFPWRRIYKFISSRCYYHKGSYYKHKIKSYLTMRNLKYLWFRDKAYLMKKPSIDRKNTYSDYTLQNCRFIELKENQSRPKAKSR